MKETGERIFVVANYWVWKPLAILSLLIRVVCYGKNHVARVKDGVVHEMVGSNTLWVIKRLLGFDVSYAPNEGSGYKTTPVDEWLVNANRKVVELKPLVPLVEREHRAGYGFLDLPQYYLYIIRRKWLLIGNDWDGKTGCRLWEGEFCSEFVGLDYGIEDAHLLAPIDFLMRPKEFEFVREFETKKTIH